MIDLSNTRYLVQCVDNPNKEIGVDITAILEAESRLADVAIVNVQTAPYLLTVFNRHWLDLHRMVTVLTYERNKAENLLKRSRAEALLNCNDEVIKSKGHSKASADLRQALADTDSKVLEAQDRVDEFKALIDYLRGKQDAFKNGYESVKKILGTNQMPIRQFNDNNRPEAFNQPPEDDDFALPKGFK